MSYRIYWIFLLNFVLYTTHLFSQVPLPENGLKASQTSVYALKNATILVAPGKILKEATLIIENGKVQAVGKTILIPKGAFEIDVKGKTIVPSFIEINSSIGVKDFRKVREMSYPQLETGKEGAYYWNEAVHPEIQASEFYKPDEKAATELQKMGFSVALVHAADGIVRGTGTLVSLGKVSSEQLILKENVASFFSFEKGASRQAYPSSLMGSIALVRQAIYDAKYYGENKSLLDKNISLDALASQLDKPIFFLTNDKLEAIQVQKIAQEFNLPIIIIGSGNEYEEIRSFKDWKEPMVMPISWNTPKGMEDPYLVDKISLQTLKEWELAPSNLYTLKKNKLDFAITSSGTKDAKEFLEHLTFTMKRGLLGDDALAALTTIPAKIIGVDSILGTLEVGKLASFSIFDNNPFEYENAKVVESWSVGNREVFEDINRVDIRGKYRINLPDISYVMEIKGKAEKPMGYILSNTHSDSSKLKVEIQVDFRDVILNFEVNDKENKGRISLHGNYSPTVNAFLGSGLMPDGRWVKWSAIQLQKFTDKNTAQKIEIDTLNLGKVWFPNMAYGFTKLPEEKTYALRNATLWTNEKEGVIKDGTVIIKDGKIDFVGSGNFFIPAGTQEIDCKGMFITSGIIDEHSHIAILKGVNESGQANSAEVRIEDVIRNNDINIYRQLSGGVTVSHILHGSANPIGGQSAIIKLKWGFSPQNMLVSDAPKFIKFALGENVKQSNWGDAQTKRFPQTRMGVEQLLMDAFTRAKAYQDRWSAYNKLSSSKAKKNNVLPPAVDLELETLVEILNKKRFITCHSYVASEITMLMDVADTFGFKVNTFTHILEGYKVANRMAQHGAGGSTFSDWWGYKYEVKDAIPYNAAIMSRQGVTVSISSDDAEMGRRLNQEAAKTIKYGGMTEEEAWKMVTLNPAKLLHIDDRMGSLKKGKDADIVIWSANPLTTQAKVVKTFIDGILFYDASQTVNEFMRIQQEKARIIQRMIGKR